MRVSRAHHKRRSWGILNMVHHRINLLKRSENAQINVSSAFLNLFENIELDVAVVDASEVDTYNVFQSSRIFLGFWSVYPSHLFVL